MISRIEHSSTTLLAVGESINNSENVFTFPSKCSNLCLRIDIYRRGIDFLKKLNVNSTSFALAGNFHVRRLFCSPSISKGFNLFVVQIP